MRFPTTSLLLVTTGLALPLAACGTKFQLLDEGAGGSGGSGSTTSSDASSSAAAGGGGSSTVSVSGATSTGTTGGGGGDCTPIDDRNDCTSDTCEGGIPVSTPVPFGEPCATAGGKVCDGEGHCVECNTGTDCPPGANCEANVCTGFCSNGSIDGNESDVDCGGQDCPPCDVGKLCYQAADCWSSLCARGFCVSSVCGNSSIELGEECDDGNFVDGDNCDSNCTLTACGNGIQTNSEECDDGNPNDGDGCDASCMIER